VAGAAKTTLPRRVLEAAACALAAHALVYRTILPTGAAHGYFTWYEPVVAGASLLSFAWLVFAVLRAARRRELPAAPFGSTAGELFGSTFLFVLVQESLEGTAATGHPAVATLAPTAVLGLSAASAAVALVVAAARCLGRAAVHALVRPKAARVAEGGAPRWQPVLASTLRPRPLAERFGMRAPPFAAA
jgi:hypothetical protein